MYLLDLVLVVMIESEVRRKLFESLIVIWALIGNYYIILLLNYWKIIVFKISFGILRLICQVVLSIVQPVIVGIFSVSIFVRFSRNVSFW